MKEQKTKNENINGETAFLSIEKRISRSIAILIVACNVLLGVITAILSYNSAISAVTESIDETSIVAGNYVAAALKEDVALAYETGSIARLADPERAVEDKQAIIDQRIEDHGFWWCVLGIYNP